MKASSVWGVANVLFTSGASHSLGTTQPRATGITPLPQHGASFPKPTPLPRPDYFNRDLVKKTVAPEKPLTMMIGHDNICGWLSGRDDDPYACKVGDTCGLILAQTTSSEAVMCFNKVRQTYDLVHACIDSSAYYSSSACDSSCVRNTFTSKCTNSSLPYCMTYAIFGDVTDYRCHSVSEPAQTVMASYTFDHRTSGKYWYGSVKFELPFFEGLRFTEIPYNFPTQEPIQDSRKTPVGAIVGGVVGGVAAIASPSSNQVPLQSMAQNQDPAFYDSHFNHSSKSLQVSAQQYPPRAFPPQGGDFTRQPRASELQAVPAQQLQQQQPPHELQTQAPQLHPQRPVHEVAA
ncbi:hypothetical protein E4U39_005803 [Claviceps sp. Clav50 group G5]|nr:hypothetical protein E4U39_005803 [Claviceps sp. Clav50 group G5]